MIGVRRNMRFRMQREPLQQIQVAMLFASGVARGAAGDDFKPVPKRLFVLELAGVANDAQQGFLEGVSCFVFISAGDNEQKLVKSVKIKTVKFAEGLFIAGANGRGEGGYVR